MNQKQIGVVLVAIGAVCFSAKAVIIKLAYRDYPVDAISLLSLRFGFSLPFFVLIALWQAKRGKMKFISIKEILWIGILSIIGYYIASLFDFMGLKYLSAGLERIILFIYPTLVVIFSRLFLKKNISKNAIIALFITYLGIAIIGFTPHLFQSSNVVKGAIYVLISAVTYSLYLVFGGEIIIKHGSINFNSISLIFSSVFVLIHFGITSDINLAALPNSTLAYGMALAIVSTVIPTFLLMEGIRLLGANKGAIVASIGPVSTIILGYYFLGETLSFQEMIGSAFVLIGVLMVGKK